MVITHFTIFQVQWPISRLHGLLKKNAYVILWGFEPRTLRTRHRSGSCSHEEFIWDLLALYLPQLMSLCKWKSTNPAPKGELSPCHSSNHDRTFWLLLMFTDHTHISHSILLLTWWESFHEHSHSLIHTHTHRFKLHYFVFTYAQSPTNAQFRFWNLVNR